MLYGHVRTSKNSRTHVLLINREASLTDRCLHVYNMYVIDMKLTMYSDVVRYVRTYIIRQSIHTCAHRHTIRLSS